MSLDDNLEDLRGHERDFAARRGFTYTVLEPASDDVVGCVYIYPLPGAARTAHVTSWVRAARAELDEPLRQAVGDWLESAWLFEHVEYPGRTATA